jgi:hypothetical protein
MRKFPSASGSVFRAITDTDITHTVIIIRTGIIIDRTIAAITIAPIAGQADIGITVVIIPTIITGDKSNRSWLRTLRAWSSSATSGEAVPQT